MTRFDERAAALAREMTRQGDLTSTLALADLYEEHGDQETAEGIRQGRLVPKYDPLFDAGYWLDRTPEDDPAVVG